MANVLYIGNRYISNLGELRNVFTKEIPSISDKKKKNLLYDEIKTLFHDNVILQWLNEGGDEEKLIARDLNAIDKNGNNSDIIKAIGEAVTKEKYNIERHLSDYLQLVEKTYSVNGGGTVDFSDVIEYSTENNLSLDLSYKFKCVKSETERFEFLLTLQGNDAGRKTVNVSKCVEGKEYILTFRIQIPAMTMKSTIRLIVDQNCLCQSEFVGDGALTFNFTGHDGNHIAFKMIKVKGGSFKMASNYEVELDNYYIGEVPVTQKLWKAVMHGNSCRIDVDPSRFKGANKPVENVSWGWICQSGGFLERLNNLLKDKLPQGNKFTLPTEAQWEFAARGGIKSQGFKYSGNNTLKEVGWYDQNSNGETHDVKKLEANELKLYDMSGNVWEWCSDCYSSYPSGKYKNPKGPSSGSYRVHRGGSWCSSAEFCAVTFRNYCHFFRQGYFIGLRFVLSELRTSE